MSRISQSAQEFNAVKQNLELLARGVLLQMKALRSAMEANDADMFLSIVETDKEIDKLELDLDDICVMYMQNRAPLGPDLRFMVGAIDIAGGLERIGDCIEYVARRLGQQPTFKEDFPEGWDLLNRIVERSGLVLERAYESWAGNDPEAAKLVPGLDDAIDDLQHESYRLVNDAVRAGRVDVEIGMKLVMMVNKIESMADIACHIAETVVFIILAHNVRHSKSLKKTKTGTA